MSYQLLFEQLKALDDLSRAAQACILDRAAFGFYLRKGSVPHWMETLQKLARYAPPDFKFNPYHDNRGRFTYAPGIVEVSDNPNSQAPKT